MGDAVGLDKMRAEGDEHLSDDRFAGRDAAGEADFQHRKWPVVSGQWSVRAPCTKLSRSLPEFSSLSRNRTRID